MKRASPRRPAGIAPLLMLWCVQALSTAATQASGADVHQQLAAHLEEVRVALEQGAIDTAETAATAAQALEPALPADAWRERIDILTNVGAVAMVRGQLARAQPPLEQALQLARAHAPGSASLLRVLNNLGFVQRDRGALREARALLSEGRQLADQRRASSLWRAMLRHNLAQVDYARGDYAQARAGFADAAELLAADDPDGARRGASLLGLLATAEVQGDAGAVAAAETEAARIFALQADSCQCSAMPLLDLGYAALRRADLPVAAERLQRAHALQRRITPDSGLQLAAAERGLGSLALYQDRVPAARQHALAALRLEEAEAQSGLTRVASWQLLAHVERRLGNTVAAGRAWCAAMDALDPIDLPYLGDPLSKARFHSRFLDVYLGCVQARLDLGQNDAAYRAWRAARARGLREALLQRDLALPDGGPVARPAAELHRPAAGTLLLDYAVAETEVLLFALDDQGLEVHRIGLPDARLGARVRALRALIARGDASTLPRLQAQSARLYRDLLQPVAARLARARRLQIAADGVLHELPFAALWNGPHQRWLIEEMAVSAVDDGGAGAAPVRATGPQRLLAVADPMTPQSGPTAPGDPLLRGRLAQLPPLPGARREARAVRLRFPGPGRLLLGAPATASRIRLEARDASVLHLAVHGVFDPLRPLESALLLAAEPGREDGLLPAWQVFRDWRLPATRLVVLSACDTGLGGDFGAEGQLGISRAFRFAGAEQVLATLWRIDDGATVALMADFYDRWQGEGETDLAVAWQAAVRHQLALAAAAPAGGSTQRGVGGVVSAAPLPRVALRRYSHPYYWAGFVLHAE